MFLQLAGTKEILKHNGKCITIHKYYNQAFALLKWILIAKLAPKFIVNMSDLETTTMLTLTGNDSVITIKNITNEVKPLKQNQQNEIPIFPLMTLGVLVLVLLSPIIRTASIGTTSLELTTIDRTPDKQVELEFIEK